MLIKPISKRVASVNPSRPSPIAPAVPVAPVVSSPHQSSSSSVSSSHSPKKFKMEDIKDALQKRLVSIPKKSKKEISDRYIVTGVDGLDELFENGIPKGVTTLVCGGPGSGKTILCLQMLYNAAKRGEKCLYMTFEESPERLREHMRDFGWDSEPLEKSGDLLIKRISPLDVTRQIDAMMEQLKGELLIDIKPLIFPAKFHPSLIVIDSLSAIASAFYGKEETYRLYIEQLFRLLESANATTFLISETPDPTSKLTESGVEEFLADGVIVMYNVRHGNVRESAIEVLKMRGAGFKKRVAALQIETGRGIVVYPDQEVFTNV